jgi:hypothetical protein
MALAFSLVAVTLAAFQAWPWRFWPSTIDLVSYLDIGDAYVHGRWADAVNGYWNPLYSWVLGAVMALVRPAAENEYPVAKAVDCAIFVACLIAFSWFLTGLRRTYRSAIEHEPGRQPAIPDWAWIAGGYTLFLWSSLRWITVTSSTPDMSAAALNYLAWGVLFRLRSGRRTAHHVLLGVVLALGYYARTPGFIVAVVMLVMLGVHRSTPRLRRAAVTAGLVFVVLTTPFIAALSHARHHVTIGDNGILNHAWLTSPGSYIIPNRHWQGGPPGYGAPKHPSRQLVDVPATFEFASPIGGTYPPWTDPSYWYDGLRYHFDAAKEWASLADNLGVYYEMFGWWWLLAVGATLFVAGDLRATKKAIGDNLVCWVPAVTGLALYLVANDLRLQWQPTPQPPARYMATYVVVTCFVTASSLRFRSGELSRRVIHAVSAAAVALDIALLVALGAHLSPLPDSLRPTVTPWQIARGLRDAGVAPGARVAIIGSSADHELWARLARVRVVADVPDQSRFWASGPSVRQLVLRQLAHAGAQYVVSSRPAVPDGREGWQAVRDSTFAVNAIEAVTSNEIDPANPGRLRRSASLSP